MLSIKISAEFLYNFFIIMQSNALLYFKDENIKCRLVKLIQDLEKNKKAFTPRQC